MIITSPNELAVAVKQKEAETVFFLKTIVKKIPSKQFDELIETWSSFYSRQIDCTKCANCCKTLNPSITEDEVKKYEFILNKKRWISLKSKLYYDSFKKTYYHTNKPCMFLENNTCSIYRERPASCAEYPHLNRKDQKYRIKSLLENYTICPIVFNIIEKIKILVNIT